MKDATLHVKIDSGISRRLKELARRRDSTLGELVRLAIARTYALELSDLDPDHSRALAAYEGGFISLGKLAEVLGRTPLEARIWLRDRGIRQTTGYAPSDAANA